MQKDVTIRKAGILDVRQIKKILFGALEEYEIAVPDNFSVADIDSIGVKTGSDKVFVLQKENSIIGFVVLRPIDRDCIELKRFYLASPERGKGLGKYLLNYALDLARKNNYKSIRLETTSRFKEAVALYRQSGFMVSEEVKKAPGHDLAFEKN